MKKLIALVLALVYVLGLVGCSSEPKIFEITGAEKLTVMSGSTGESVDITNADDIKYITDNINALKYSKGEKVNSDGWSYALQWFDQNGEIIENLTLWGDGYTIIYDGHYYKGMSVDYDIDLSFLDSWFVTDNTLPYLIMVDGKVYQEHDVIQEIPKNSVEGHIAKVVLENKMPSENDSANFGEIGMQYWKYNNEIYLQNNDCYTVFVPIEELKLKN